MSLPIALKSILSTTFSLGLLMWVCSSRISRSAPNSHSASQWFIRVLPNTPLAIGQTASGAICWQPMSHFRLLIAVKCSMLVQWMKIWQTLSIIKLAGLCSLPLKFYITIAILIVSNQYNKLCIIDDGMIQAAQNDHQSGPASSDSSST
jgi:hypothetical protein